MTPPTRSRLSANRLRCQMRRLLMMAGFGMLGAFGGVGWVWVISNIILGDIFELTNENLLNAVFSLHAAGGIVGFLLGSIVSLRMFKAEKRGVNEDEIIHRYVGSRGHWMIFAGVPTLFTCLEMLLVCLTDLPFERRIGTTGSVWVVLVPILAVYLLAGHVYNRVPKRLVIPIGLAAWLLTFFIMCWFFLFGPGALKI